MAMAAPMETCRACLSVVPQQLVHLSETIEALGGTMTYAECFQKCTRLPALDVFPQSLCVDCAVTLHRVYLFIRKAEQSDQELRLKYAYNAGALMRSESIKQEESWLPDDLHSSDMEYNEYSMGIEPSPSKRIEVEETISLDSSDLCNSTVKERISKGLYKLTKKRGRSKVWNIFSPITNEAGVELEGIVACRQCNNVYKYHSKGTSNLLKHKCYVLYSDRKPEDLDAKQEDSMSKYLEGVQVAKELHQEDPMEKYRHDADTAGVEVTSQDKKVCGYLSTKWMVDSCRPLSIIEDPGLRKLAQFLIAMGANYGKSLDAEKLLPHSTHISHNINDLYKSYSTKMKQEIQQIKPTGFAVTCDLWTDDYLRKTYFAATIHYIGNGQLFSRLLGLLTMEKKTKTVDHIKAKLTHLLQNFNLELNDQTIIVTDRAAEKTSAFEAEPYLYCVNHLIDECIETGIEDEPDFKLLVTHCNELVTHFNESGIESQFTSFLKDSKRTRWNRVYYMMLSIQSNFAEIEQILTARNEMSWINPISFKLVNQLVALLRNFEAASVKLEADNYPTIHLAYVHIHQLKKTCLPQTDDIAVVRSLKEKLTAALDGIAFKNMTILHKVALYLFPPANALSQFSDTEKEFVRWECKRLSMSFTEGASENNVETSAEPAAPLFADDVFSDFIKPVVAEDRISNEMATYESINVAYHDNFDVLQWWHLHKTQYPRLYRLSTFVLAAPASSAPSERVFARARNLITDEQSIGNEANQIMFKHCNFPHTKLTLSVNS